MISCVGSVSTPDPAAPFEAGVGNGREPDIEAGALRLRKSEIAVIRASLRKRQHILRVILLRNCVVHSVWYLAR